MVQQMYRVLRDYGVATVVNPDVANIGQFRDFRPLSTDIESQLRGAFDIRRSLLFSASKESSPFTCRNDALLRQIELQKEFRAPYVSQALIPSSDDPYADIVVPFTIPHTAAKKFVEQQFLAAMKDGNIQSVYHLYHTLLNNALIEVGKGRSKQHLRVTSQAILDQLSLEFCCTAEATLEAGEPAAPGSSSRGLAAEKTVEERPHFYVCMETGSKYKNKNRWFYPAAPRWFEPDLY
jgi:hypothetical protein